MTRMMRMSRQFRGLLGLLRVEIAAFVSWWLHELRDLGETLLVRVAPKLARRVVVRFEGSTGSIWMGGQTQPLELVESLRGTRAVLVLDRRDVLTHELHLPAAVERELDRAIELHLERELPLPRERVCVDWKVIGRNRQHQRIVVSLLVVHREHVDRVLGRVTECGLRPIRIGVAGTAGDIVGNVLPRRVRPEQLRLTPLDRRLMGAAVGLAVLTLAVIGGQWMYERVEVGRELQRTSGLATTAETVSRQLTNNSAAAAALVNIMAKPDAVDVLTALTANVPRDSWAYELEVTSAQAGALQIKLGGFTPTATTFVDVLEQTPELEQVRLVSAASAGLGTGKDRLRLTARWAGK